MSDVIDIRTRRARPKAEAAKAPPPWFRFFAADFVAKTRGLSAAETGILIRLVANMHDRGEPLTEDHARLARLCGTVTLNFRRAIDALLAGGLLVRKGDGLWSPMVQAEVDFRHAASARRSKRISEENPTKSMGENDRDSETQSNRGDDLFDRPFSSTSISTPVDKSGSHRKNDAPLIASHESLIFRVGAWRVNSRGERYMITGIDPETRTVAVRFEDGRTLTTRAPAGAVLKPEDELDEMDDEIPY